MKFILLLLTLILNTLLASSSTKKDHIAPVITLNGEEHITLFQGDIYDLDRYEELGARALDDVDGEVNVSISGEVYTYRIGTDTIVYTAIDSSGNKVSISREITIIPDYKILISKPEGHTAKYGETAEFQISLSHKPTSNVIIHLESSDKSEGVLSDSSRRFETSASTNQAVITPENWMYGVLVFVKGTNKNAIDGKQDYHIVTSPAVSSDTGFHGIDPIDVEMKGMFLSLNLSKDTRICLLNAKETIDIFKDINYSGNTNDLQYSLIEIPDDIKINKKGEIKWRWTFPYEEQGIRINDSGIINWTPKQEHQGKVYTIKVKVETPKYASIQKSVEVVFKLKIPKFINYKTSFDKNILTINEDNNFLDQASFSFENNNIEKNNLNVIYLDKPSEREYFKQNPRYSGKNMSNIFMFNQEINGSVTLRLPIKNIPKDKDINSIIFAQRVHESQLLSHSRGSRDDIHHTWITISTGKRRTYLGEEVLEFSFRANRPTVFIYYEDKTSKNKGAGDTNAK